MGAKETLTRREALKKGVLAAAWATPVVQVLSMRPAMAQETSPGGPPQQCNEQTTAGGAGVTTTIHELGVAGPTSFLFEWEAFGVPDQFEVIYEGAVIHNTGFVGDFGGEGTGSATVNVPAGSATTVTVRVTGPAGTAWNYTVNCP
jgi:hypothetical protein